LMAVHESVPATREHLLGLMAEGEVFNIEAYLDIEEERVEMVPRDLIDYCRGDVEGTDLQLSDSKDLPLAQAIAEEELAVERGADEDGLPFGPDDARFHRVPRPGPRPAAELAALLDEWLQGANITLPPGDSPE
jgi:hypothetical protein